MQLPTYIWTRVLVLRWMCLCSVLVLRHINRRVENKVVCPVSSPVVIYSQRTLFWFAIDASLLFVSSGQQLLRTLRTINSIQLNRHNTRLQIVRNRVVSEEKREPRQNSVSRSGHGQSQVTVAAGGSWRRRRSSNEMEDDVTKEMWMWETGFKDLVVLDSSQHTHTHSHTHNDYIPGSSQEHLYVRLFLVPCDRSRTTARSWAHLVGVFWLQIVWITFIHTRRKECRRSPSTIQLSVKYAPEEIMARQIPTRSLISSVDPRPPRYSYSNEADRLRYIALC